MLPGALNRQQQPQPCPGRVRRPLQGAEGLQQRRHRHSSVDWQHRRLLGGATGARQIVATHYAAERSPQASVSPGSTSQQPGSNDSGHQHSRPGADGGAAASLQSDATGSTQQQVGFRHDAAPSPAAANGAGPSEMAKLEMLPQQDFGRCALSDLQWMLARFVMSRHADRMHECFDRTQKRSKRRCHMG